MSTTGKLRGHDIYWDGTAWRFVDTDELTAETHTERACGHCHLRTGDDGHDPCIGRELPGVMNACCGHGTPDAAYIQERPGGRVGGPLALNQIGRGSHLEREQIGMTNSQRYKTRVAAYIGSVIILATVTTFAYFYPAPGKDQGVVFDIFRGIGAVLFVAGVSIYLYGLILRKAK